MAQNIKHPYRSKYNRVKRAYVYPSGTLKWTETRTPSGRKILVPDAPRA